MPARTEHAPGGMTVTDKITKAREYRPAARVFIFTCEVCGGPACFGVGVNLRRALTTGNVDHAGKWYCREHNPAPDFTIEGHVNA